MPVKCHQELVDFVFARLAERGWPVQGKLACAMMLELGYSQSTLRNWQRGAVPQLDTIIKVLGWLGYSLVVVP